MNTQTALPKRVAMAAIAAIFALLSFGLVACNADQRNEEVIRSGVTQEFEAIKNLDEATLEETLGDLSGVDELSQFGISTFEFCQAWLAGFDYTIDDVTVNGKEATVTATITVRSLSQAMNDWQSEFTTFAEDDAVLEMSADERNKAIGAMLLQAIENALMETNTVTLPYMLEGDTWVPGPGFDAALGSAFAGEAL